jgi:hypothetical protein
MAQPFRVWAINGRLLIQPPWGGVYSRNFPLHHPHATGHAATHWGSVLLGLIGHEAFGGKDQSRNGGRVRGDRGHDAREE